MNTSNIIIVSIAVIGLVSAEDRCFEHSPCDLPVTALEPDLTTGKMVTDPNPPGAVGGHGQTGWNPQNSSYRGTGINSVGWIATGDIIKTPPVPLLGEADHTTKAEGRWKTLGSPCARFQVYYQSGTGPQNPPVKGKQQVVETGHAKLTVACQGPEKQ